MHRRHACIEARCMRSTVHGRQGGVYVLVHRKHMHRPRALEARCMTSSHGLAAQSDGSVVGVGTETAGGISHSSNLSLSKQRP